METLKERMARWQPSVKPVTPTEKTLANQAPRNRPKPESVQEQRARAQSLRAKVLAQQEEVRLARLRAQKHHVGRLDGKLTLLPGKPTTESVGKFHSKKGTSTRSAKGRTSIKPNGYAVYIYPWWDNHNQVVMY